MVANGTQSFARAVRVLGLLLAIPVAVVNGWSWSRLPTRASWHPPTRTAASLKPTPDGERFLDGLAETPAAELEAAVDAAFDSIGQAEMRAIVERANADAGGPWVAVLGAVEAARHQRMEAAKAKIESLLDAGEIRKLDTQLVQLVKQGDVDPAFMFVLNGNIAAATVDAEGSEGSSKLSILTHISTRIQEELEKLSSPETGIVHKLMRTEDAALRGRILQHYLTPQTSIGLPDGSTIPLDAPKDALVAPMSFSSAVADLVTQLRGLDIDGDLAVSMIEQVRQLAKEARAVIVDAYPAEVVEEFTESLTPTFQGAGAAQGQ